MRIKTFTGGPLATHCYLAVCTETHQALVVDCPKGIASVIREEVEKQKVSVAMIVLTHSHWDHIADAVEMKQYLEAPLYVHPLDAPNLVKPGTDGLPLYVPITGAVPDGYLQEEEELKVGVLRAQVLATPGHSPGGVCLWFPEHKILFSGDTLFKGGVGNISLPTANASLLEASLRRLATLPPDTRVYPGHGPSTTIGAERASLLGQVD